MTIKPKPTPLLIEPKRALNAIGSFIYEFARLESGLRFAVAYLADPGDARIGWILVSGLSFDGLLGQLEALCQETTGRLDQTSRASGQSKLAAFLADARKCQQERNRLAHGFYRLGPVLAGSVVRHKVTARGGHGLTDTVEELTPDEIMSRTEAVQAAQRSLDALIEEVDGQRAPRLSALIGELDKQKRYGYLRYHWQFYKVYGANAEPTSVPSGGESCAPPQWTLAGATPQRDEAASQPCQTLPAPPVAK
jgi:hypothetical protein